MARDKWRDYVLLVTEGDSQRRIKAKTGIDQGTISRWLSPTQERSLLEASTARKFATAYDLPILEVLVHAGVLTEKEARISANAPESLTEMPILDLLAMYRRTGNEFRRIGNELARRVAEANERNLWDDN